MRVKDQPLRKTVQNCRMHKLLAGLLLGVLAGGAVLLVSELLARNLRATAEGNQHAGSRGGLTLTRDGNGWVEDREQRTSQRHRPTVVTLVDAPIDGQVRVHIAQPEVVECGHGQLQLALDCSPQ